MAIRLTAFAAAAAVIALAAPAVAQTPPAPPPPTAPLATPNPHYVAIQMEMDVARPAAEVWGRIGKYCDISAWLGVRCQITSGQDGEIGAVRTLNGATIEVLVGKTDLSYTYTQPVRVGPVYNLYHGCLEARPTSATTTKLIYTLLLDNSMLPDDAARAKDIEARRTRFTAALRNMKILAEGGVLPAPTR
jgi:hypothetical protein